MDERFLKSSVESIEMPEDMKERIIKNCKSGEAQPLMLPKKRFSFAAAAAACVCVTAVALAGVGIWQAGVLSDGGSDISIMPGESGTEGEPAGAGVYVEDISDRIINIIPLTTEEVAAAQDEVNLKWDDYKKYSDEQLADYFGIDLTALSGIFPDVLLHWGPVDYDGRGVYSTDNGVYFDRNTYLYVDESTGDKNFQITASRLGIPNSVKKLWSNEEMLSRIDGTTVAIGKWQDMTVYEAEFSTSAGTFFHITAFSSIDELEAFITTIIEKTQQYLNGTPLTLEKLLEICSGDCSKLSWSDFEQYESREVGSGLYILKYSIDDKYDLFIGGVPDEDPWYMTFGISVAYSSIDIREGGLEDYLASHANDVITVPLTLDKLKEVISNSAKIGWSEFEQYDYSETYTDGFCIRRYDIDGLYYLLIGGDPEEMAPEYMYFSVMGTGQSGRIDIRFNSIDVYIENFLEQVNTVQDNADQKQLAYEYLDICQRNYNTIFNKLEGTLNAYNTAYSALSEWDTELDRAMSEYNLTGSDSAYEQIQTIQKAATEKEIEMVSLLDEIDKLNVKLEAAETELLDAKQSFVQTSARTEVPDGPNQETIQMVTRFSAPPSIYWAAVAGFARPHSDYIVSADDFVKMNTNALNDYYGVNVIPQLPKYMDMVNDRGNLGLYRRDGGTGEVYIDINAYEYVSNEYFRIYDNGGYHSQNITVEVMKGAIPESCEDLWLYPDLLSNINGTTVAIGEIGDRSFTAEFFVGDVGFHIVAYYITLDQLTDVISSLTAQ